MSSQDIMPNDEAYANASFIPGGAAYPDRWAEAADEYRRLEAAFGRARLNVPYGPGARQAMDLFYPSGRPKGLTLFIHGGYWLRFGRETWSHFSKAGTQAEWVVAMPSYTLAPEASIADITAEMIVALEHAAGLVQGPIRLTGHSAGGHLVGRLGQVPNAAMARLEKIVPISPVGDLRPLLETSMNATLGLDAASAQAQSPVLHPAPTAEVQVVVGAQERPAFVAQAKKLATAWDCPVHQLDGCHHFDVIDGLATADSDLAQLVYG